MLKTVIRNLLSNAIKFSNEGSEVLIKVEESDGMSVVSVKDSGCGIDEESQKKLVSKLNLFIEKRNVMC